MSEGRGARLERLAEDRRAGNLDGLLIWPGKALTSSLHLILLKRGLFLLICLDRHKMGQAFVTLLHFDRLLHLLATSRTSCHSFRLMDFTTSLVTVHFYLDDFEVVLLLISVVTDRIFILDLLLLPIYASLPAATIVVSRTYYIWPLN